MSFPVAGIRPCTSRCWVTGQQREFAGYRYPNALLHGRLEFRSH